MPRLTQYFILIPLLFSIILFTLSYNFTIDDTYISLRYAQNFAEGHGLVFNTDGSPPIEGYTNLLWVLIQSTFFKLPIPPIHILDAVKLTSLLFNLANIILISKYTYQIAKSYQHARLATLLYSLNPFIALWTSGGLETPLYIFLILLGLYTNHHEYQKNLSPIFSTLIFLLLSLTRPEGIIIFLAILLTQHFIYSKPAHYLIIPLIIFFFPYLHYLFWRYEYYGYLLPNTFYAKQSTFNLSHFQHRSYQLTPLLLYLLPFFTALILHLRQLKSIHLKPYLLPIITLILLYLTAYLPHTEWMPGYRYELPFITILLILSSPGISQFIIHTRYKILRTITLIIYLLIPIIIYLPSLDYSHKLHQNFSPFTNWLIAIPARSYAGWDMGLIPYQSQLPTIIDIYPQALLNIQTTHHGYHPSQLLSSTPDILALPHPLHHHQILNPKPMLEFYQLPQFQKEYQYLFTLTLYPEYQINIYHHQNFPIPEHLKQLPTTQTFPGAPGGN